MAADHHKSRHKTAVLSFHHWPSICDKLTHVLPNRELGCLTTPESTALSLPVSGTCFQGPLEDSGMKHYIVPAEHQHIRQWECVIQTPGSIVWAYKSCRAAQSSMFAKLK